ncbi:MAG: hypothetical protein KTR24_09230, partial [Saprospiraceae bacterium]|nr:hypothetical protein [Saprospiraceae bacterium]
MEGNSIKTHPINGGNVTLPTGNYDLSIVGHGSDSWKADLDKVTIAENQTTRVSIYRKKPSFSAADPP